MDAQRNAKCQADIDVRSQITHRNKPGEDIWEGTPGPASVIFS